MAIIRQYRYQVTGMTGFPLGMLRYDRAWPTSQHDVSKIALALGIPGNDKHKAGVFHGIGLNSFSMPTNERWDSFGWKVSQIERIR